MRCHMGMVLTYGKQCSKIIRTLGWIHAANKSNQEYQCCHTVTSSCIYGHNLCNIHFHINCILTEAENWELQYLMKWVPTPTCQASEHWQKRSKRQHYHNAEIENKKICDNIQWQCHIAIALHCIALPLQKRDKKKTWCIQVERGS
jgi:hypothetical protein